MSIDDSTIRPARRLRSTRWPVVALLLLMGGSLTARAESALIVEVASDDDVDPRLLEALTDGVREGTTGALAPLGLTVISNRRTAAALLRCGDDGCRRAIARARELRFIIQGQLRVLSNQARLQLVVSDGERVIAERSVTKPAAIDLLDVVNAAASGVALEAYRAAPPPHAAPPPAPPPSAVDGSGVEQAGEAADGSGGADAIQAAGSADGGSVADAQRPTADRPRPDARTAAKVASPGDPTLGIAVYWGLVLVAGGLGAAGLALDVVPATAKNHQFDLVDLSGPVLYVTAGTIAAVATLAPLPGSAPGGPTVGTAQCAGACAVCLALGLMK